MTIAVYRFFVDYAPARETKEHVHPLTGETVVTRFKVPGVREVHKVEYGPLGSDKQRSVALVEHLKAVRTEDVQQGSAAELAAIRWSIIEPLYEKWLKGQEITPEGTPLAAWSGVGPEQAEGLRRRDIHTVEQLAQLNDSHFERYGIQGLRQLRDNAKRFVASQGSVAIEQALAEKDIEIAGLKDTLADMREMLAQMKHTVGNLQMAQQATKAAEVPYGPIGSDDGGDTEQDENNDDAFGGEEVVAVTTPRRQARR